MTIVEQSGGQYHVLLIIADGQVYLIHISYRKEHSFVLFKYAPVIKYFIGSYHAASASMTLKYYR